MVGISTQLLVLQYWQGLSMALLFVVVETVYPVIVGVTKLAIMDSSKLVTTRTPHLLFR